MLIFFLGIIREKWYDEPSKTRLFLGDWQCGNGLKELDWVSSA